MQLQGSSEFPTDYTCATIVNSIVRSWTMYAFFAVTSRVLWLVAWCQWSGRPPIFKESGSTNELENDSSFKGGHDCGYGQKCDIMSSAPPAHVQLHLFFNTIPSIPWNSLRVEVSEGKDDIILSQLTFLLLFR